MVVVVLVAAVVVVFVVVVSALVVGTTLAYGIKLTRFERRLQYHHGAA